MLPRNFLEIKAKENGLTEAHTKILIELFYEGNAAEDIPSIFHIAPSTVKSHLNAIYSHFGIKGEGSGKLDRLRSILTQKYKKMNSLAYAASNNSENNLNDMVKRVQSPLFLGSMSFGGAIMSSMKVDIKMAAVALWNMRQPLNQK
jgi:hypothetical protein